MLSLRHIYKAYEVGESFIEALKDITIDFRESEFVSVLGHSGCGKTTLLNIIGGLDQYSDGDLIINDVSTKKYKSRDWDSYRNHSVGFVFQSYNLIPHQTVLANVELALTLSGVSKSERKKRAIEVLKKVGLGDQLNKKPNQMSGGQVQRVAIARALINNPDILLADEPTGALDSTTSLQIMELLKEVAKDKLVIMVTHNPELAEKYSTRIVKLLDGRIVSDSNPYKPEPEPEEENGKKKKKRKKRVKKPSMSFFTALSLSFNNLLTKKGRTFMTAFAGSIGIIGIALIAALSSGFKSYISRVEEETLSSYPLSIEEQTVDMSSMITSLMGVHDREGKEYEADKIYSSDIMGDLLNTMTSEIQLNNMADFKEYIEDEANGVKKLTTDIQYGYNVDLNVYRSDTENGILQVNPSKIFEQATGSEIISSMMTMNTSLNTKPTDVWKQLLDNDELLRSQYDLLDGKWPESYNEVVLIVNEFNEVSDMALYTLGLKDQSEIADIMKQLMNGEGHKSEQVTYTFDDFIGLTFKVVPNSSYYQKQEDGTWKDMRDDEAYLKSVIDDADDIKIVGIIKPNEDSVSQKNSNVAIGYTVSLTEFVMDKINDSEIVKAQKDNSDINVLTGKEFAKANQEDEKDAEKEQEKATSTDAQPTFDINMLTPEEQQIFAQLSPEEQQKMIEQKMAQMQQTVSEDIQFYINSLTPEQQEYFATLSPEEQQQLIESMKNDPQEPEDNATYESNLKLFGSTDVTRPTTINIYPKDFESKEKIIDIIEEYNNKKRDDGKEADVINYTDYIGLMISSVSSIISAITYVLIAFVAISLIVSSIMIGIITYISVLERTKEIGILRSIGASKKDISRVFRSETIIEGFVSGALGILVTEILIVPINIIIEHISGIPHVASLPYEYSIALIVISMALTLIAGVMPSRVAANKDPVEALRTE
ncbi:MAG: ATP-binding cassette domain-containing protein [Acutalibacteraceae bacterium]